MDGPSLTPSALSTNQVQRFHKSPQSGPLSGFSPGLRTCGPGRGRGTQALADRGHRSGRWNLLRRRYGNNTCAVGPAAGAVRTSRSSAITAASARLPPRHGDRNGLQRSATFRQLVDRVGTLSGIVYAQLKPSVNLQTKRELAGALSHTVTT